ncbi:MAG: hypothetical protein KJ070_26400 [Verrucomicrobia bacterium]|nr:hypothetical protein [Verrucomicrobiota bacterium]
MNIPKSLVAVMMLAMLTTGCLSALGGGSGNVPLSDLSTNPTVQIDWPEMTLTIPPSNAASVGSVSPKVKVEGESIIIEAKYVLSTKPAVTTFNLKKLGMPKEKAASAKVFWMNPDGTKHALELKPKKSAEK